jgi:hypothetical protein
VAKSVLRTSATGIKSRTEYTQKVMAQKPDTHRTLFFALAVVMVSIFAKACVLLFTQHDPISGIRMLTDGFPHREQRVGLSKRNNDTQGATGRKIEMSHVKEFYREEASKGYFYFGQNKKGLCRNQFS